MRLLLLFVFITSLLYSKEVSVFGAGDLESSNPYGLTQSEKVILKNDRRIDSVKSKINSLSERIDGIESIFNGDSEKLNKTSLKLDDFIKSSDTIKLSIEEIKQQQQENIEEISKLKKDLEEVVSLKVALKELVKQVKNTYVTKKDFNKLLKMLDKKEVSSKKAKASESLYSKPKKELLKEAKKLFNKNYITKSKPIFEYLAENKYRPAECNFYIGEIWFFKKKYKKAIHHFKTSMMLYDKAKYIPKLLLHSAISFEKTNDLDNAANFYGTLIDVYPDTKEAKQAQNNLSKIN